MSLTMAHIASPARACPTAKQCSGRALQRHTQCAVLRTPQAPSCGAPGTSVRCAKAAGRRGACPPVAATAAGVELVPVEDAASFEAAHAFQSYANWVVPGALMVGRYPFVEPEVIRTRAKGEEVLKAIVGERVTTFVCVQGDLPAQTEMTLAGTKGFLPYKATADMVNSAVQPPPPIEVLDGLRNPTLDAWLPKRRSSKSYTWDKKDLSFAHRPVTDAVGEEGEEDWNLEKVSALVEELAALMAEGEVVYMHCWGGCKKAGAVAACVLARSYGLGADAALAHVQAAYDTRMCSKPDSSDAAQRELVEAYVKALQ